MLSWRNWQLKRQWKTVLKKLKEMVFKWPILPLQTEQLLRERHSMPAHKENRFKWYSRVHTAIGKHKIWLWVKNKQDDSKRGCFDSKEINLWRAFFKNHPLVLISKHADDYSGAEMKNLWSKFFLLSLNNKNFHSHRRIITSLNWSCMSASHSCL